MGGRLACFGIMAWSGTGCVRGFDLGRQLFELFLDEDMQYSCAPFRDEGDSLETAQKNKVALIARKLMLRPGLSILDIGSGCGGLALLPAGCPVRASPWRLHGLSPADGTCRPDAVPLTRDHLPEPPTQPTEGEP